MRKTLTGIALAASATLLLSACSGSPAATPEPGAGPLIPVTIGVVPVADVAPLYVGIEQGFFEEEGLDVTLQNTQGAAAAIPLLLNGEMQFAYGAFHPVISAAAAEMPVVYVAGGIDRSPSPEDDYSSVIVKADSPIDDMSDLEGQTVAINALRAGPHLVTRVALEEAGVDPESVEFIEVPMTEAIAAVERGSVDAAYLAEPFTTQAIEAGYKVIGAPAYAGSPEGSTSGYFSVTDFVEQNSEVVDAFVRALEKSVEYSNENIESTRAQLQEYSGLDEDTVSKLRIPTFTSEITLTSLETIIGQLADAGWLDSVPEAGTMVRE